VRAWSLAVWDGPACASPCVVVALMKRRRPVGPKAMNKESNLPYLSLEGVFGVVALQALKLGGVYSTRLVRSARSWLGPHILRTKQTRLRYKAREDIK
jgi:hypothetical protein